LRSPTAGDDAELDLGQPEDRSVRRDAQVARQRQLAPAPEGVPRHGGDDDPGDRRERVEGVAERLADGASLVGAPELGDVGARREDAIAAGHHDRARRIVGERAGGVTELFEQRARQGVDLGVVEADRGDAVVTPGELDEVRHVQLPYS
jgi:hypothetical protein